MYAWHLIRKAADTIKAIAQAGLCFWDISIFNCYAGLSEHQTIGEWNIDKEALPRFLTAERFNYLEVNADEIIYNGYFPADFFKEKSVEKLERGMLGAFTLSIFMFIIHKWKGQRYCEFFNWVDRGNTKKCMSFEQEFHIGAHDGNFKPQEP